MELLSDGTRRALARWDGRPRQILALACLALAALLALTGGEPAPTQPPAAAATDPAEGLAPGHVAAVVPAGAASLLVARGDIVDVYAAPLDLTGGPAQLLAAAARVLSVTPTPSSRAAAGQATGYVVLELTDDAAGALAGAADARLTVVVRARDG